MNALSSGREINKRWASFVDTRVEIKLLADRLVSGRYFDDSLNSLPTASHAPKTDMAA